MRKFLQAFFLFAFCSQGFQALGAWGNSDFKDLSYSQQFIQLIRSNQKTQDIALRFLIEQRCSAYLNVGNLNPALYYQLSVDCYRMSFVLLKKFDVKIITFAHPLSRVISSFPVAFVSDLEEISQKPEAMFFLEKFLEASEEAAMGFGDLNPAQLASTFTGDEKESRRWMAVLFQDTSPAMAHLQYLKLRKKNPAFIALLEKVLTRWSRIEEKEYHLKSQFIRHPGDHGGDSRSYHYYVPAYLSHLILAEGQSPQVAALGPFLMNYLYECLHIGNPLLSSVQEPARFEQGSLNDIFLGLSGALEGAGLEDLREKELTLFQTRLQESPARALRLLGKTLRRSSPPLPN